MTFESFKSSLRAILFDDCQLSIVFSISYTNSGSISFIHLKIIEDYMSVFLWCLLEKVSTDSWIKFICTHFSNPFLGCTNHCSGDTWSAVRGLHNSDVRLSYCFEGHVHFRREYTLKILYLIIKISLRFLFGTINFYIISRKIWSSLFQQILCLIRRTWIMYSNWRVLFEFIN